MSDNDAHLNWAKILTIGLIPIILIFIGFYVFLSHFGTETYDEIISFVDDRFGLLGIFLYVFIVDTLIPGTRSSL